MAPRSAGSRRSARVRHVPLGGGGLWAWCSFRRVEIRRRLAPAHGSVRWVAGSGARAIAPGEDRRYRLPLAAQTRPPFAQCRNPTLETLVPSAFDLQQVLELA